MIDRDNAESANGLLGWQDNKMEGKMKLTCDPMKRLCCSMIFLAIVILLFLFSTPRACSRQDSAAYRATETATPASMTPATVGVMLDALVRFQMCMQPDAATGAPEDIPVIVLDPPSDASPSTEAAVPEQPAASPPVFAPPSTSYFLRVNQTFATEKEAIDYADNVVAEPADECWIGASGARDSQRFTLLIGPFRTQGETARVQTKLTRAKIRTLFVNDGYLRRFRSVIPVPSPQQPAVSSIALAAIQPIKPQGQAIFPPRPTYSHCLFFVSSGE
ncbi:MAG: hypothetical protein HZC26_02850 [Candidatus Magasanikbacteria bacterium]|nr:hypothetical protein [Candidatus Magasanikbacteria bacterium]